MSSSFEVLEDDTMLSEKVSLAGEADHRNMSHADMSLMLAALGVR